MDYPAHGGFGYWLYTVKVTGGSQSWRDSSFIHSRVVVPVVKNKVFNKGVDYPPSSVNGGLIPWS